MYFSRGSYSSANFIAFDVKWFNNITNFIIKVCKINFFYKINKRENKIKGIQNTIKQVYKSDKSFTLKNGKQMFAIRLFYLLVFTN